MLMIIDTFSHCTSRVLELDLFLADVGCGVRTYVL